MTILERYITKYWIKYFLVSFLVLFLIASLGDFVNNLLRNKYTFDIVLQKFYYSLSFLFSYIIPTSCLTASFSVIHKLKSNSELIAILASGFPKKHFYRIGGALGIGVFLLQFGNLSYFEAHLNHVKTDKNVQKNLSSSFVENRVWVKNKNYLNSYLAFIVESNTIIKPTFYFFDQLNRLTHIVIGDSANFLRKNLWELKNVKMIRKLSNNEYPQVIRFDKKVISINEDPDDLRKHQSDIFSLDFFTLLNFIQKLRKTGININEYYLILYHKVAMSLACLVFIFFPFITLQQVSSRQGHFGKSVLFIIIFSLGYWFLYSTFYSMGLGKSLPPFFAAMTIPFSFLLICLLQYRSLNRI
jgi:lipopolysaccharide export LptBFGC system permease protein LptF